jgi:cytochrome bd-type quinol oxidase subunit 2
MVHVNNFTYGPLTPVLGFVMSSLGCFLGLRCTTRARASHGTSRVRWLLLATASIATTGIWVMHFVAMLGFTIPGQTITYSVPVTVLSMLIAVVVVGIGLLIVGFGTSGWPTLLLGGLILRGIGIEYRGKTATPAGRRWSPCTTRPHTRWPGSARRSVSPAYRWGWTSSASPAAFTSCTSCTTCCPVPS